MASTWRVAPGRERLRFVPVGAELEVETQWAVYEGALSGGAPSGETGAETGHATRGRANDGPADPQMEPYEEWER